MALFGVLMVGLVWLMRRWLGKMGAYLAAVMFTISPALLYHSRYIRDEVILCALTVLLAIALFRYLETRARRWLIWTAVALGLALTTMEAGFILGGVFGLYLLLVLGSQLWLLPWPEGGRRSAYRVAVGVALPALLVGILFLAFKQEWGGLALAGLGALAAGVAVVLAGLGWRGRIRRFPELDLVVLLFTLVLPFLSAFVMRAVGWDINIFDKVNAVTLASMWRGWLTLAVLFLFSAAIGWYWLRNRWVAAAAPFWAIELVLFTTFLTNGAGIGTGLIGSLGYWIDQQEVMRGGQPWYYFFLLVPLYEFLPLLLSIAAGIAWLSGRGPRSGGAPEPVASDTIQEDEAPAQPRRVQAEFVTFLVFWVVSVWGVFTYVGEKMPWHVVYFATPMALLGGWWLGRVIEGIDWGVVRVRGGYWLLGLVPLLLVVLKAVFPIPAKRPFVDETVTGLSNTAQWMLALVVGMVLAYLGYGLIVRLGWRLSRRLIVVALAGLLGVFTVGVAYRFAFIDYDYPTEPMVYAHGTPDIKLAMSQIEQISRETVGGHALKVAYDTDAVWPLEWYLRDYSNRVYFGDNPSRAALDVPVAIIGEKSLDKVRPYLGDRYYEFSYRLIWWPRETYKDLTWERIWNGIKDPVQRGQFWDVVLRRRYTTATAAWEAPYAHRFSLFVRKDVAAQVWHWGAAPAAATAVEDPYLKGQTRRDGGAGDRHGGRGRGGGGRAEHAAGGGGGGGWHDLRGGLGEQPDRGVRGGRAVRAAVGEHLQAAGGGRGLPGRRARAVQRAVGDRRGGGRQRVRGGYLEPSHPEVR